MFQKSSKRPKKTLREPDSFDHGYNYAIFLLGLSMRTVGEVEFKMKQRGYTPGIIKEVVARLLEDRYLNDEQYLEAYLENFKNYQTYGWYMIKKKMLLRRLPEKLIETKLQELLSVEDETEIATRYAEHKLKDLAEIKKMPYQERQKFMGKMLARGFRMDVLNRLTNEY